MNEEDQACGLRLLIVVVFFRFTSLRHRNWMRSKKWASYQKIFAERIPFHFLSNPFILLPVPFFRRTCINIFLMCSRWDISVTEMSHRKWPIHLFLLDIKYLSLIFEAILFFEGASSKNHFEYYELKLRRICAWLGW